MTNKEFILKLIKYTCFGLLLFAVFVLSFGCGFYYRDSGHIMQVNAQSVKLNTADSSTSYSTFITDPMLLPTTVFSSTNINSILNYLAFGNYIFSVYADGVDCRVVLSNKSTIVVRNDGRALEPNNSSASSIIFNPTITWQETAYLLNTFELYPGSGSQNSTGFYIYFTYRIQSGFVSTISSITIGSSTGIKGSYYGTTVLFTDINGKTLNIQIIGTSQHRFLDYVPVRTIYIPGNVTDNDYYQNGYLDGYNIGNSDGQVTGYDNGYNVGYNNGDLVGYQRGIQDSNQYTFLNLIGAVIDAPITAFVNLLDFNVFGFNMLNLCCSLLTLSLIILVVKFVLFRS